MDHQCDRQTDGQTDSLPNAVFDNAAQPKTNKPVSGKHGILWQPLKDES